MRLTPKNWSEFQHYKDRKPHWVKLHRDLLTDRSYMRSSAEARGLAPLLWLLACESSDGSFDASLDELEWRLRLDRGELERGISELVRLGFFVSTDGSTPPQCVEQPASELVQFDTGPVAEPETEKRREEKRERREEKSRGRTAARPGDVSEETWEDWIAYRKGKRAVVTGKAMQRIQTEATKAGMELDEALTLAMARGWQGFEADWVKPGMRNGRDKPGHAGGLVSIKPKFEPNPDDGRPARRGDG